MFFILFRVSPMHLESGRAVNACSNLLSCRNLRSPRAPTKDADSKCGAAWQNKRFADRASSCSRVRGHLYIRERKPLSQQMASNCCIPKVTPVHKKEGTFMRSTLAAWANSAGTQLPVQLQTSETLPARGMMPPRATTDPHNQRDLQSVRFIEALSLSRTVSMQIYRFA